MFSLHFVSPQQHPTKEQVLRFRLHIGDGKFILWLTGLLIGLLVRIGGLLGLLYCLYMVSPYLFLAAIGYKLWQLGKMVCSTQIMEVWGFLANEFPRNYPNCPDFPDLPVDEYPEDSNEDTRD